MMESETKVMKGLQKNELGNDVALNECNDINQHNQYLKPFESHHINCLLTIRKKEQIKSLHIDNFQKFSSNDLNKDTAIFIETSKQMLMKQDQADNSLIFRPKNIRKQQQVACLHEPPAKVDKKDKFFPYNPEKGKSQQFKILTRKSQEYQPLIQWIQQQNPANMTLPS